MGAILLPSPLMGEGLGMGVTRVQDVARGSQLPPPVHPHPWPLPPQQGEGN
jgi:hypothetical protein